MNTICISAQLAKVISSWETTFCIREVLRGPAAGDRTGCAAALPLPAADSLRNLGHRARASHSHTASQHLRGRRDGDVVLAEAVLQVLALHWFCLSGNWGWEAASERL